MIPKSSRFKCCHCGHLKKRPGKCVWCGKIADFNFPVPVLAEPQEHIAPRGQEGLNEAREAQSWQAAQAEVTSKSRGGEYFMSAWRNAKTLGKPINAVPWMHGSPKTTATTGRDGLAGSNPAVLT